jgi:hypothetical protein
MSGFVLELLPFLALGGLGALHCAGMCGVFAAAVACGGEASCARSTLLYRQAAYVVGKAFAYGTLGLGLRLGFGELATTRAGSVAAGAAGLMLILLGLRQLGWRGKGFALRIPGGMRASSGIARFGRQLVRLPGWSGAFAAGALNGLVPCGLSLGAVALAATAQPAVALLGPVLFGLSTAPALLACGLGARWLASLRGAALPRRAAPLGLGVFWIAGGAWTGLRGLPAPGTRSEPRCCEVLHGDTTEVPREDSRLEWQRP